MDDDAGALGDHRRQQRAIEADGRHQVLVQRIRPFPIIESYKAAARRARPAENIDDDVDTAEPVQNGFGDCIASFSGGEVGGDVTHAIGRVRRDGARRRDDAGAGVSQNLHHSRANAFRSAHHERATVLKLEIEAHGAISSVAIFPPAMPKM